MVLSLPPQGMPSLDHGPNPNSSPMGGGGGQVLGESLPSPVFSASSWQKLFVRITLELKGKNKDAELQLWLQFFDLFLGLLGGPFLGSHRGKLRPQE